MKLVVGRGIDNYISSLKKLNSATETTLKRAVYEGAGIIANEIKERIHSMPTQEGYQEYFTGIKRIQRAGLIHSLGIARIEDNGKTVNTKIGFDGYNYLKSKKYPQGQPNAMIARTFESGNSFTKKIPFVAPAVRAKRSEAEKAMARVVDEEVKQIMD